MKNFIKKLLEIYRIYKLVNDNQFYKIIISNLRETELAMLCDNYGSDKGSIDNSTKFFTWPAHSYTEIYSELFSNNREDIKRVFECGIGTNNPELISSMGIKGKPGASLRVWRDYFPNAQIYGGDIDKSILFEDRRISTYYVDQQSENSIKELWSSIGKNEEFDVMIDDGLHTFDAAITLFENSVSNLNSHGVYVIEDVYVKDLRKFYNYFNNKNFNLTIAILGRKDLNIEDNCMLIIKKITV